VTRPSEKHLEESEIDALLSSTGSRASMPPVGLKEARDHARHCHSCSRLMQIHIQVRNEVSQLRADGSTGRATDCPQDVNWLEVAAGLCPDAIANELLWHAARCHTCGDVLKQAVAVLSDDVTVDEGEKLLLLRSAGAGWTAETAAKLSQHVTVQRERDVTRRSQPSLWVRPLLAIASICLAAVWVGWFLQHRGKQQDSIGAVQNLLTQAYSDHRTLVLRFPGASHSSLRISRGSDDSRLDRSPALLEAESRIAQKQAQGVRNAEWLIARAQADILEWKYNSAITALTESQALSTSSNELTKIQLNLSAAYFERAQASNRPADYGKAADLLGQILETIPNDPIALFNRAIVYEKLTLLCNAASDWKRYLQVDANGDWSAEARQQLSGVESQIERKGPDCAELQKPNAENPRGVPFSDNVLDSRIEEYQQVALVQWLPRYLRSKSTLERKHLRKALNDIARLTESLHHDHFFSDVISSVKPLQPNSMEPVEDLKRAIENNQSGKEHDALLSSQTAEKKFGRTGNIAGAIRAQFEEVYARQFSFESTRCQNVAQELANKSHRLGYRWVEAQALIEQGFCANMAGNLSAAKAKLVAAVEVSRNANYEETLERALVGEVAVEWEAGSPSLAWALATDGLWKYWHSSTSEIRGISFLDLLDLIAEETQQWRLQKAVLEESLPLVERQKDPLIVGQTRYRLAFSELMTQQNRAAEANLLEAARAFASAPKTDSTLAQETVVSISLAKAEMQRGDFRRSLDRLDSLRSTIKSLQDNLSLLDYYSTLGEVYRNLDETEAAELADRTAVEVFTKSLDSISAGRDRLTWYREASLAYRSLVQLRIDKNDPDGALNVWESYRKSALSTALRSFGGRDKGKRLSVSASSLHPDKEIIYVRLPGGLYGWIRMGGEIHGRWLRDDEKQYERERVLFAADCADPSSSMLEIAKSSRHLYSRLILPFEQWLLAGDNIAIQPDDELTRLPFSALVDGRGGYINTKYNIVISPSGGGQFRRQPVESFTRQDAALFVMAGDATMDEQIHDPSAEREVRQIASLFSHPEIVAPGHLSIPQFESLLSHASVFHYAGHSLTTSAWGGELMVQLRDSSGRSVAMPLRSQYLSRARLRRCKLVVLSACSTDRGEEERWLDRENLALTFLEAGVPEVVASQWDVDSEATAGLMNEFYAQLLEGASTAKALSTAAERVRRAPGTSHPYYWAAFSVLEST
jgi:CHAT domain-containing protein/tetratricopeptide (TPR) repeat protein